MKFRGANACDRCVPWSGQPAVHVWVQSHSGVSWTPVKLAADAWFTLDDHGDGTQVQSLCIIPVGNVAVEHPLLPVARRTSDSGDPLWKIIAFVGFCKGWSGVARAHSPDTPCVIRNCGPSGRCSDSRYVEVEGRSLRPSGGLL